MLCFGKVVCFSRFIFSANAVALYLSLLRLTSTANQSFYLSADTFVAECSHNIGLCVKLVLPMRRLPVMTVIRE